MDHQLIGVPIRDSRPSFTEEVVEILEPPEVQVLGVPDKVHTSHGVRVEEILRAFGEAPNASAREAPKAPAATTTQQLAAAGMWHSGVPLCSQQLLVGLRATGQDCSDCDRGSPNLYQTSTTSSTHTEPGRRGAAPQAPRHLQVSRRSSWGSGLRSLFWLGGFAER